MVVELYKLVFTQAREHYIIVVAVSCGDLKRWDNRPTSIMYMNHKGALNPFQPNAPMTILH
jgi:hypothetical protein